MSGLIPPTGYNEIVEMLEDEERCDETTKPSPGKIFSDSNVNTKINPTTISDE